MREAYDPEELAGLHPVQTDEFISAYLHARDKPATTGELASWLKNYISRSDIEFGIQSLHQTGAIDTSKNGYALSRLGKKLADEQFGPDVNPEKVKNIIWPAMALGLKPSSKAGARLSRGDTLRGVALTAIFGLPLSRERATLSAAVSALILRALAEIDSSAKSNGTLKELASQLGDLGEIKALRRGLIRAALRLGTVKRQPQRDCLAMFSDRVQAVTNKLSTPPFSDAVSIAQVYDAYGREYADAGELDSFKSRLLEAQTGRLLNLKTLDLPEALEQDLRSRSELRSAHSRYHMITRNSLS